MMKNLNDVSMHANGGMISVDWKDDAGNRHHVWLEVEQVPGSNYDSRNKGYVPARPYRVRREYQLSTGKHDGRMTLYRNAPLKDDGSPRTRRDEGYFETRNLDCESKANAAIVAEALRIADVNGMFDKAVDERERKEREQAAIDLKNRAAKMREALDRRIERHAERPQLVDAIATLMHLEDEDLVRLANLG